MNRKGITQTQFNWIFIAIAGAIILLFFISMVYKQKSIAEQKTDITIQRNLQAILTGAEISKQAEHVISVPEKEFRYDCEGFSIGSLSPFNPRIVFAPDLLKSKKKELILYSLEWRVPFRISNFLYVTSPEVRYIIVGPEDLAEELKELLPENMNIETVSNLNNIPNKNNYKIKFIFFNNIQNKDLSNLNGDISAINLLNELDEYGGIEFYNYNNKKFEKKKTLSYLKKESLIGSIFSENAEIYECNMEKAMTRLEKVYDIYEKRIKEIKNMEEDVCKIYYDLDLFDVKDTYEDIYKNTKNIYNKNQAAALLSCPLIY